MIYIVVALLSAIFGFGVAALMCASGRASAEEELFRLYQTIADYKKILEEYKRLNHETNEFIPDHLDKSLKKVPKNETEVLKLLNESIEMLWIIHEHTRKNKKFISEAIDALHSARRSNYVNHVDWDTLKIGD